MHNSGEIIRKGCVVQAYSENDGAIGHLMWEYTMLGG